MTDGGVTGGETDVRELRRVAEQVARDAADLVRTRREGEVRIADRKSSAIDLVTEVDREAERFLRERLATLRAGDGFFGEEGTRTPSRSGVTWVVDPIDGTTNFVYGIPHYAVSVAAVDADERSLAGAVVEVPTGRTWSAALACGASREGVPLRVRPPTPLAERLVATGFGYQRRTRELQGAAFARFVPRVRDARRQGSSALDLCSVADGTLDAYVEEGLHLWDRAAAGLVATEAGATLEVLTGVAGLECVVCAPAHGYDELRALVEECGFLAPGAPVPPQTLPTRPSP